MNEVKIKLKYLLKFYNENKNDCSDVNKKCPFARHSDEFLALTDGDCSKLCYEFAGLTAVLKKSNWKSNCPCHVFGRKKSMLRLKTVLINYNMLKEN